MAFQFVAPARTIMGKDALKESSKYIKEFGKRAFIVSGKIITKTGGVKKVTDCLDEWGISHTLFNDIVGEPTDKMIEAGTKEYIKSNSDFVIAIGGGSPLDSAKAISAMAVLPGKITDYHGVDIDQKLPPMVLIPTTSGTGSESAMYSIITDTQNDIKMRIKGESLIPDLAIVDSSFTLTAPKSITASTGMDALAHAIETFISKKSNVVSDMYGLEAVKRIFKSLPTAYHDGQNEWAREEMSIGSYFAGMCINLSAVTVVHGMSRPIGALFHVPHGISNAMLMKDCLEYIADGCEARYAIMARAIGAATDAMDDKQAAKAFVDALSDLVKDIEIPTLREYGIKKQEFDKCLDKMVDDAMMSGSPQNSIRDVDKGDLRKIYKGLWE